MVKLPAIDIIIPNFNKAKYLDECLNSIINQTYKKWKIYLIDDCAQAHGAYLNNMRLWDIVAGIALLRAAKKETWLKSEKNWIQMENKLDSNLPLPENPKSIQKWRGTIVAGENDDVLMLKQRFSSKKIIKVLVLRILAKLKS